MKISQIRCRREIYIYMSVCAIIKVHVCKWLHIPNIYVCVCLYRCMNLNILSTKVTSNYVCFENYTLNTKLISYRKFLYSPNIYIYIYIPSSKVTRNHVCFENNTLNTKLSCVFFCWRLLHIWNIYMCTYV